MGGRKRGELTPLPMRSKLVTLIQEACDAGSRLKPACKEADVGLRTYRRWFNAGQVSEDKRPTANRPTPANKLTEAETDAVLEVSNREEFASLPPSQIVPTLLDRGEYIASESSFYRILKAVGQLKHRGRSRPPQPRKPPTTYIATAPNQVWSWDITYLPSQVKGQYYYLYMHQDLFSRYIVGHEVHDRECGELAAQLLQRSILRQQCFDKPPVLHSDNGAPMKSLTMKAKMEELGVAGSYSRARVSNDNPYAESLFRTLKYCPQWPRNGFACLEAAREWVQSFVEWYNTKHKHSGINFVTPHERLSGQETAVLAKRKAVLESAKAKNQHRWSGDVRNCEPSGPVALNPEKVDEVSDIKSA